MFILAPIRHRLFRISPDETKFDRRGFPRADPVVQHHLETAGRNFIDGYNAALAKPQAGELAAVLSKVDAMYRGFAFEGAAMALALLDLVTPWNRRRWQRFAASPAGDAHLYMLHVGAGWAAARHPWAKRNFARTIERYHPLYRWLLLDGFGFHEGFFRAGEYVGARAAPSRLSRHAARVFDQGLGRSMWFSQGADSERIAAAIWAFPASRHEDLWSGVGLAASYAGGVERGRLEELRSRAADYGPHLAQGAAFAAKARQRAGNLVPHTELASDVFCRLPADQAAAVTDECLRDLPADGAEPAYQVWRARISERFGGGKEKTSHERDAAQVPVSPWRNSQEARRFPD
ncbi:MAG: DUF1702 family protein [Pirellulales bacterium]